MSSNKHLLKRDIPFTSNYISSTSKSGALYVYIYNVLIPALLATNITLHVLANEFVDADLTNDMSTTS